MGRPEHQGIAALSHSPSPSHPRSLQLGEIDTLLSNSAEAYPHFERFCQKLYSPVAHDMGWDAKPGEHHTAPMLRSLALGRAAKYGDKGVVEVRPAHRARSAAFVLMRRVPLQEARVRFAKLLADRSSLSPDLRGTVYAIVLRCVVAR